MMLGGWGNFPQLECRTISARGVRDLASRVAAEPSLIARGNGRAYGDAALNPQATLLTCRHNRILSFDRQTGRLQCESGVLLRDIVETFAPLGWFPSVTPGTKFVTVGGMIAADVHGKNHHAHGSFTRYVEQLELILPNGDVITCSPTQNSEVFAATCGGMGLTGVISSAMFRLQRIDTGWIRRRAIRCATLERTLQQIEEGQAWTYSAAWIDCLAGGSSVGRALLFLGEHAAPEELPGDQSLFPPAKTSSRSARFPLPAPGILMNKWFIRSFNEAYFRLTRPGDALVGLDSFFYPLDTVAEWNRFYGKAGFIQYQCVLPKEASAAGLRRLLTEIEKAGLGSFLAVLKLMGPTDAGLMSFPMEGYTLALDMPLRRRTLEIAQELDAIVEDHGGRIYLAKDACARPSFVRKSYPHLPQFQEVRRRLGADGRFSSQLARRLSL